jgi:hypothetical protein
MHATATCEPSSFIVVRSHQHSPLGILFIYFGSRRFAILTKPSRAAQRLIISTLRYRICDCCFAGICALAILLVGKTLRLLDALLETSLRCQCSGVAHIPWPPRLRHFLSCLMYTVCQACDAEGSHTAVAFVAQNCRTDSEATLCLHLDVWRELGCAMDESEAGWKCHALSPSTLADALEN